MDSPLRPEPRLPGESPCHFMNGLDGWTTCSVHGWTGYKDQRSRVLVCPSVNDALSSESSAPSDLTALREAVANIIDAYESNTLTRDDILAAAALSRSSVSAQENPDDLGAAWKEAEAALPLSGWLSGDGRWVVPSGSWAVTIRYRPDSGDGYSEPHYPAAYFAKATMAGGQRWERTGDDADTPAAALRSLALRLSGNPDQESGG